LLLLSVSRVLERVLGLVMEGMVVVMEETVAVTADTVGAEVAERVGTAGTATSADS
jgi:hypothetical protein